MLHPKYLEGIADDIVNLYSQLETDILQDMVRRIARLGKITDTTIWQAQVLTESGAVLKNIQRLFKKYDKSIQKELYRLFNEAMIKNIQADNRVFSKIAGRTMSDSQTQIMLLTLQKTRSDLERLTLSTAESCNSAFFKQANAAHMKVHSGAFDYKTAIKQAITELSRDGITLNVSYNNTKPVKRTIESAVRANILTSVNHSASAMTLNNCSELNCDLVEVTAHFGSRPSHEAWQGKIYSLSGKSDKYPPFSICGYGEADGICGINCRHSFYPYFEKSEKHYSQDDLDSIESKKVTFDGKEMSYYDGMQKLRHIERGIRYHKRNVAIKEAAGLDCTAEKNRLFKWQEKARNFTKQTGIERDYTREYIGMPNGKKQPRGKKPKTDDKK